MDPVEKASTFDAKVKLLLQTSLYILARVTRKIWFLARPKNLRDVIFSTRLHLMGTICA
jgi:hypothetical protein